MSKILKITLLALSYFFILSVYANTFDPDLGWHLRFGQDVFTQNSFPYADTYTWAYQGQNWVNHEWGGDILFWFIYQTWGYTALTLIMAAVPLLAFVLAVKIFKPRLTALDLVIIFILLFASGHLLVPRLAIFTPLFLATFWYLLEKCPKQNNFWLWPPLLWLWSILHGSWLLGFIVALIYLGANLGNLFCQKYYPKLFQTGLWGWREIKRAILSLLAAAALITVNPYGLKIFEEVGNYLNYSYFKTHITEWVPSYTYPVFWLPLIIAAMSLPLVLTALKKQKITWPQLLLFLALWLSAWQYKRQAILLLVASVPLFALFLEAAGQKIFYGDERHLKMLRYFTLAIAALMLLTYTIKINRPGDLWNNTQIMKRAGLPLGAVNFLEKKIDRHPAYLFNEYSWGGYLNWRLPRDLVFLDGRSAATWQTPGGQSYLQYYQELNYLPGGLLKIEQAPVRYIILSKFVNAPPPDLINRLLFSKNQISQALSTDSRTLVKDLKNSPNWRLIYEDNLARVWERINLSPGSDPTLP